MLWAGCLTWCAAVTVIGLHGQQPEVVAHVLDVKGVWHLEGATEPLAAGKGLVAGARITAGSNRQGDAVTIVHDEDMSRVRMACDGSNSNPCRNPMEVKGVAPTAASQSQLRGIVQAALAVLLSRPPAIASHYALTLTRGKPTVLESEAVVAFDPEQRIVLPPVPESMPAGQYTISTSCAGQTSSPTVQTGQLTSEGTWRPLPWDAPGLYEVSIINANGERVADMMLLVTTPMQYQGTAEAFDAMKTHTATWTGLNARSDEHLFLRAFLLTESQP